jgi:hypothetical protein
VTLEFTEGKPGESHQVSPASSFSHRCTAFNAERLPDRSIRIIELVEKSPPRVAPIRTRHGLLMLPSKVDREVVAAAIRADRTATT